MDVKVLTAAEVAEIRKDFARGGRLTDLCDTVELLRDENTRLKGLIEGMGHEEDCPQRRLTACSSAPDDECDWVFSGCTKHPKEKFACDCIQSKVNA